MSTLKIIQAGCGAMGQAWMDAASKTPEIEVVGLVDVQRTAAEKTAEKFHLPASVVYGSLTEALKETSAEAVFDVTIPSAHEAVVIESLRSGRHVLGEKPMSETLESAQRMVATAEASGKTYAVTQNYRYRPPISALRSFLNDGTIGSIEEAHADFYMGAHFGGFRDEMDYPLILDMSIHTFDAARFLTGADPLSVYCHSFNPHRSWYKGDASAIVIFEMTDGIIFSYRGSWCAEGRNTGWDSHWRLIGSRGSVSWDGREDIRAEIAKDEQKFIRNVEKISVSIPEMPRTGHAALMDEFVASLREGRKPQTDCRDNIKSLAMVLAAVESAKTGKKVSVTW